MKKKLLTVLLAVVMVFGVFGLTACGGSNADEDYNYYGIKYEIEDEVKIEAVTFQAVYKMFTTAGSFVLYVDSETGASTKANMQAINGLANEWGITIYHFNPDLTGGYAKDLSNAVNANIITALDGIAAESQLKAVQDTLLACSNSKLSAWTDATLYGIKGAESVIGNYNKLNYKGSIAKSVAISQGADKAEAAIAAVALKKPSFGAYTEADRDEPTDSVAFQAEKINTMNLFGDARLHMYDDRDALKEEKTDVYVTVANYAMFAHLLDNNEGYFPVFFGGTWCPNTQAIAKETDKLAKDYGITKIYFFDPRLDDGVRLDDVAVSKEFSLDKMLEDQAYNIPALQEKAADAAADLADAEDALAANTDATKVEALEAAVEKAKAAKYLADFNLKHAEDNLGYTVTYSVVENKTNVTGDLNTRAANGDYSEGYASYNYNYTYGSFLKNYLNTYKSEWNITGSRNNINITVGSETAVYTRMCVPNIMMFNGEEEGKAALVALAEAEYYYADVNVEGTAENIAWTNAVKAVFDANPYAEYLPIVAAPEAAPEASAPAASAPAAGGAAEAC